MPVGVAILLDSKQGMRYADCQQPLPPEIGVCPVVVRRGADAALIKSGHGGKRAGAGRKPKPIPPPTLDIPRWFCVRTEYGTEIAADMAIRAAGFETLLPLLWVAPTPERRTELGRTVPAQSERLIPLFKTYLMVRFLKSDPSWRHIATMRGVAEILSSSPENPTAIPDREIEALRNQLGPNGCLYENGGKDKATGIKKRWVGMLEALSMLEAS